jgi:hypothetical protein
MPYKQRLNSWIIVRLLPNLQRSVVGRFRSWSDADGQIRILRQLLPEARLPNSRVRSGRSLLEQLVRSAETGFFTEILDLRL